MLHAASVLPPSAPLIANMDHPGPPFPAGKELDLKYAVALEDPDPASGVQAKLRAKLRVRRWWWVPRRRAGNRCVAR